MATKQGQVRIVEHWPWWGEHNDGVAGREEEEQRTVFPGEFKLKWQVD